MCRICCTCRMRCMRRQRRWPRGNAAAHAWRAVYRQTTGSRQLLTANQQWPTASLLPTSGLRRSLPCMAMPAGAACVPATRKSSRNRICQHPLPQSHLISANTHPAGRSPIWHCMIGPCACIGSNLLRAMRCLALHTPAPVRQPAWLHPLAIHSTTSVSQASTASAFSVVSAKAPEHQCALHACPCCGHSQTPASTACQAA